MCVCGAFQVRIAYRFLPLVANISFLPKLRYNQLNIFCFTCYIKDNPIVFVVVTSDCPPVALPCQGGKTRAALDGGSQHKSISSVATARLEQIMGVSLVIDVLASFEDGFDCCA